MLSTKNFNYLINIIKHRIAGINYKKISETGIVNPIYVQIMPTLKCNLKCKMCLQKEIKCNKNELDYGKMVVVLKNLEKMGIKRVDFIGGEIFLMKDIYKILDLFKKRGFILSLGTNGTLLKEKDMILLSKYNNIISIGFSLDGLEKTHDNIRGVKGSFKKTVNSIVEIKKRGIDVGITCVLQKDNFDEIPKLMLFLKKRGINNLTILFEIYSTSNDVMITKNIIKKMIGHSPQIFLTPKNEMDYSPDEVERAVKKIKKYAKKIKFNAIFKNEDYIPEIFNNTVRKKHKVTCDILATGNTQIDWNGDLNVCPFIGLNVLGNLSKKEIKKDIFNSDIYKKIRKKMLNCNLLPICDHCCQLNVIK